MARQFVPAPNRNKKVALSIFILIVIVIFAFPKTRNWVRSIGNFVGIGSVKTADVIDGVADATGNVFRSKKSLILENQNLNYQIGELNGKLADYSALLAENNELKHVLGRTDKLHFVLASVLSKPGVSFYDTLLIDGGEKVGIVSGKIVYANGETPIGIVESVNLDSAVVRLFSSSGQNTDVRLDAISDEGKAIHLDAVLIGKGGGNFVVSTPHDFSAGANLVARTKDINPKVIATFQKVISDTRDPLQKILLSSVVNVNELSFVEVTQ